MRVPMKRVLIATILLCFCASAFAAPKIVKDGKSTNAERQTVVSPEKKDPVSRTATPVREPIQTATDIGTAVPNEAQPAPAQVTAPLPAATAGSAAAYSIDWFVIASGGGSGTSTNYSMDGTVGQTAVGEGTSTNYELNSGFWQNFGPASCCISPRGDVNNDGTNLNILDLTFLVDRIFRGGAPAVCLPEADLNGDATSSNILDLTFAVDRIFRGGPAPGPCL